MFYLLFSHNNWVSELNLYVLSLFMLMTDLRDRCYDFFLFGKNKTKSSPYPVTYHSPLDLQLNLVFQLAWYLGRPTIATELNSGQRNVSGSDLYYFQDWLLINLPHNTPDSVFAFICCPDAENSVMDSKTLVGCCNYSSWIDSWRCVTSKVNWAGAHINKTA